MTETIDRRALVDRHAVQVHQVEPTSPLTVGNGDFACTVDLTGLQTIPDAYPVSPRDPSRPAGTLLGTQSTWGWHSMPSAKQYSWRDALVPYESHRGTVPYVDMSGSISSGTEAGAAERDLVLRGNPHRLDLGTIGLRWRGQHLLPEDITAGGQRLDLYSGQIHSQVLIGGHLVEVTTSCHPDRDVLAFRLRSAALQDGLSVALTFSYGNEDWHHASDWDSPELHQTRLEAPAPGRWQVHRSLDESHYGVTIQTAGRVDQPTEHELQITSTTTELDVVLEFSQHASAAPLPGAAEVQRRSTEAWASFWETGAAIDLGAVTDPRAAELERRVVLSQYLTAVNCAGSMPPQETGLVCNSWRGKFHLEMHWWHAAHFPLWGRPDLLRRSFGWYRQTLPQAREMARIQGYDGARWPKQVGPEGLETPSTIAPFLIWQQPHLIYLAELVWRTTQDTALLSELVEEITATADFMVSFTERTERGCELPPPLIPAQESYGGIRRQVRNPTYELVYWHWALQVACSWYERLGLTPPGSWRETADDMLAPVVHDGIYPAIEGEPWTIREDHPSMLCALGVLPLTTKVDEAVVARTMQDVLARWDWSSTWGWDYPVLSMTATRLGRPDEAVDFLLTDTQKNTVLPNGHNRQDGSLPLYLPGNGGLLAAVALMAGGWDHGPEATAPGFPEDWDVRVEGFTPAP
ncbi:MAG TPA: hypothetical protein VK060_08080 [Ruania sp.]|nr:hypothetical protein [Ruania sp.]